MENKKEIWNNMMNSIHPDANNIEKVIQDLIFQSIVNATVMKEFDITYLRKLKLEKIMKKR